MRGKLNLMRLTISTKTAGAALDCLSFTSSVRDATLLLNNVFTNTQQAIRTVDAAAPVDIPTTAPPATDTPL